MVLELIMKIDKMQTQIAIDYLKEEGQECFFKDLKIKIQSQIKAPWQIHHSWSCHRF